MRALGWRRDRLDLRDADISFSAAVRPKLLVPAPPSGSVQERVAKVLDQGAASTCVANAGMQAIRVAHVGALLPVVGGIDAALAQSQLGSRLWGYFWARVPEHMTGEDSGCQVRDLFAGLRKLGVPPEEAFPYSDSTVPGALMFRMPGKGVFRHAVDQVGSYHRIDSLNEVRREDVRLAISSGRAVVCGWDVSESFCSEDPGGRLINVPGPSDPIAGGHCMLIVGYQPEEVLICNSWGKNWGMGGFFRATWDWIDEGDDLWIVNSNPLFTEEP